MRQSQQFNTTAQWTTACVATGYVSRELDEELDEDVELDEELDKELDKALDEDVVLLDCLQCRLKSGASISMTKSTLKCI